MTSRKLCILFAICVIANFISSPARAIGDGFFINDPAKSEYSLVGTSVSIAGDYSLMGAPMLYGWGADPGGAYLFVNGNTTPIQTLTIEPGVEIDHYSYSRDSAGRPVVNPYPKECVFDENQIILTNLGEETAMSSKWVALSANGLGDNFSDWDTGFASDCTTRIEYGQRVKIPTSTVFLAKATDFPYSGQPYGKLIYSVSVPFAATVKSMAVSDTDLVVVTEHGAHLYTFNPYLDMWQYNTTFLHDRSIALGGRYQDNFRFHPVGLDGNRLVLGDSKSRTIYLYEKTGFNNWQQKASFNSHQDVEFGRSVDIDDRYIIVSHSKGVRFFEYDNSPNLKARGSFFDPYFDVDEHNYPSNVGPSAVAISSGRDNTGSLVTRAIVYFPKSGPELYDSSRANEAGSRSFYQLDTDVYPNKFIEPDNEGYNPFSTNSDENFQFVHSLAMDGNSVVMSDSYDLYGQSFIPGAGKMIFDRFASFFQNSISHVGKQEILDDAESGRVWFNGGEFNWLRHSGNTPSSYIGPPGAYKGDSYYYVETSKYSDISNDAIGYDIFKSPIYGDETPNVFLLWARSR